MPGRSSHVYELCDNLLQYAFDIGVYVYADSVFQISQECRSLHDHPRHPLIQSSDLGTKPIDSLKPVRGPNEGIDED